MSAIMYGVAIGLGFFAVMTIIKVGGWSEWLPIMFWVIALSWLAGEWVSKVETMKPVKIRVKL